MTRIKKINEIVQHHVVLSIGGGLVPIPLLDIAVVTAIQLDMLRQLATAYEVDYSATQGKALLTAVAGGSLARISADVIKAIPGLGTLLGSISMPILSGASTYAVGQLAIEQLETRGSIQIVDVNKARRLYREKFDEGLAFAKKLKREKSLAEEDDVFIKLEKLSRLKERGVINEAEFEEIKDRLLDQV